MQPLPRQPTTTVTTLPLKRGYYVASDIPYNQASNTTVVLIRRDGIGGSRDFCEFKKIEKTGVNTYRITQACAGFQSDDAPEISLITYTLRGDRQLHIQERAAGYIAPAIAFNSDRSGGTLVRWLSPWLWVMGLTIVPGKLIALAAVALVFVLTGRH